MKSESEDDMSELHFRYYEDQWAHIRHHETQMSGHTFQIIAFAGSLLLALTQMTSSFLERFGFAALIVSLGIIGFLMTQNTHTAVLIHMSRARNARSQIPKIDAHASDSEKFPDLYIYHKLFHVALIALGAILTAAAGAEMWFG